MKHGDQRATHLSSRDRLFFVAFYADCHHEVRPVRSGHRIVLTYNLLLVGDTAASTVPEPPPEIVDGLAECLDEHFTTPAPAYPRGATTEPPNRLVYLLDHEYTPRALGWSRLKGSDAVRVSALNTPRRGGAQ